ncbi:MarR family transcriptional regulator [uncultured Roseobacter sp.]|uniref:MarR family transcriptional regulator n=1 Tax=uncultured Roseobacter sp. TaxID=114847 RepID=UPI0026348264|nr:MarR family transcriptional regulator [uncultured Roseobacter sp.]
MSERETDYMPEIMMDIRRLYESLQKFDMIAADALGLNLTDLRGVNILGDGPLTPKEIGQRLGLTSGSVTTLIDRLERVNAVDRQPVNDRRSIHVVLKPEFCDRARDVYRHLGESIANEMKNAGLLDDRSARRMSATLLSGVEGAVANLRGGDYTSSRDKH